MEFLRIYNLSHLAEFARRKILAARMEERHRLESWKEIALYLKRSTGTCHRWEAELELPVHRLDGTPRARVFAYTDELDRWMAEKLHVADALTKEAVLLERRKRKRALIYAGVLIGLIVLAILVWRFYPYPVPIPAPSQIPTLAVLPFENVTGDENLETWTTALPVLISTDLEQSRFVNAVPTIPLYERLKELELADAKKFSPEDLKKVAEKAEADYLVTGSLIKTGEDTFITIFVQKPGSGEVAKSLRAHCRGEKDFFAAADDLTKEIKLSMNLTSRQVARDYDKAVRKISTDSPEAFKLYSQELREITGTKSQEEISLLQKAVDLDPKFALAYERLIFKYAGAQRKEESENYSHKVLEFSDRMSERHYLLFLAGRYTYFFGQKDYDKALKASEKLWSRYPALFQEDVYGQWNLPQLYMEFEEYDKAIRILENLGPRYRKNSYIVQMLVQCYESTGLYEKAKKIIDDYVAARPSESADWLGEYKSLAGRQKKYDEALKYIDMKYAQKPDEFWQSSERGWYFWRQDDFIRAGEEYRKVFNKDDPGEQSERAVNLAVLALSQGKVGEAKAIIQQAIELARDQKTLRGLSRRYEMAYLMANLYFISGQLPEALKAAEEASRKYEIKGPMTWAALHLRAMILLEMNKFDEFEKQAEETKQAIEREQRPQYMRDYYHLLGLRELKKNNFDAAISYFGKSLDLFKFPHDGVWAAHYYFVAEAYYRSNRPLHALDMYEKLEEPWVARSFNGDLYAKSFYMRAKIYEKNASPGEWGQRWDLGGDDKTKAIENYRKFLELWGNADPVFPEVEDARKSLAKLEKETGTPPSQ